MSQGSAGQLASMHIVTIPTRSILTSTLGIGADRWEIAGEHGCLFGKVLGTSKANTTKTSVELRRWALFAVWRDRDFYQSFVETSNLLKRWRSAGEVSTTLLAPLSAKGSWSGNPVIAQPDANPHEQSQAAPNNAQVAVVTRAWVKPRHWVTFTRAIAPVDADLQQQRGCLFAMGMGEWPFGEQATFSLWESTTALETFAYTNSAHKDVIRRRYQQGWYGEELFARFAVIQSDLITPTPAGK